MTCDTRWTPRGPRGVWRLVAVAVLAASAASCQEGSEEPEQPREPLVVFDTVAAVIVTARDTIPLTVELADTDEKKAYGMMERTELPEHRGMLFTYDEPQQADRPFWMYRTLLPLDIAFLDESGRIVAIRAMDPCLSPNPELCRLYAPGVRYAGALEVGQGLLERWGVDLGDRVVVSDRSPD